MYRKGDIVFINQRNLNAIANRWFSGDRNEAKSALISHYKGRTIRFTDIWRAA